LFLSEYNLKGTEQSNEAKKVKIVCSTTEDDGDYHQIEATLRRLARERPTLTAEDHSSFGAHTEGAVEITLEGERHNSGGGGGGDSRSDGGNDLGMMAEMRLSEGRDERGDRGREGGTRGERMPSHLPPICGAGVQIQPPTQPDCGGVNEAITRISEMLPQRPTAAPPLGKAGRGRPYRDPVQSGGAPHRPAGPPTRQAARGSHRPKPQPVAQEVDFEAREARHQRETNV